MDISEVEVDRGNVTYFFFFYKIQNLSTNILKIISYLVKFLLLARFFFCTTVKLKLIIGKILFIKIFVNK